MPETSAPVTLKLSAHALSRPGLPAVFGGGASRATGAGTGAVDPFLPPGYLQPLATFEVSPAARGEAAAEPQQRAAADNEVIVLELADGGVLVTSAARLRQSLQHAQPELVDADGTLHLDGLRAGAAPAARDIGDVAARLVSRVFTFAAGELRDSIVDKALEKVTDPLVLGVSWAGTKALMWAIEERLDQPAGSLRRWTGGAEFGAANTDASRPMLVFVHGTGSNTRGSFGELREGDPALWRELERRYAGGIHAFEHRTLSESPIDNAIQLVQQLPEGARVSLVSHSRGGLVADLLCLDGDVAAEQALAQAIEDYRQPAGLRLGLGDAAEAQRVADELVDAHAAQRARLADLAAALRARRIVVERYVRVASPARGTKLASGNFDLFLSGLLTLIGQVPFLKASPLYSAFKRVVIEVAKNRTKPQLVPGIEAMLPDSPMARLLRKAPVRSGIEMALIAGDIEGGGLLQRLGTFLTDTLIFDRDDNDLVVDTDAMLAGIAPRARARVLFDRGADVSHFRYFTNPHTRNALADWLLLGPESAQSAFRPLPTLDDPALAFVPDTVRRGEPETRPIVVILPGVMGSHLARRGDRIWLDPIDLAEGGLRELAWGQQGVEAEELFSLFYGALARELQKTHVVRRFPYDWRLPLDQLADRFGNFLGDVLKEADEQGAQRPVRLLAHSMGGLVVRATIRHDQHGPLMDRVMARPGARLVMCGTPHQGAHSMVENLIGKGDTLRTLVRLDLANDMQQVLDIVAGFRGALSLLPKPGFKDTFQGEEGGGAFFDYHRASSWEGFADKVTDFWFGNGKVGRPTQDALDAASWLWAKDGPGKPALPPAYAPNSIYVAGVASNTPCGLVEDAKGRLRMVGTTRGDGTVTWDSGRIDGIGSFYYLPAAHGDLLAKSAHFEALIELLDKGRTARLATSPPVVRALEADAPVVYDAAAPAGADAVTLARMALGASLDAQVEPQAKQTLAVRVRAMDLRFVAGPILVGHYENDPISGPEALIDRELLDGLLRERHELGLYAGPRGTAVAVLQPEDPSGRRPGAVVTGLGPYDGTLTQPDLVQAVRAGVLRYLLHVADVLGPEAPVPPLTTLLLGYNSSANLTVAASVEALVRGVVEANARFQETTRGRAAVTRLDIVELYRDTAITACYALRDLAPRLVEHGAKLGCTLAVADDIEMLEGARSRLFEGTSDSYWPRLVVSAERSDDDEADGRDGRDARDGRDGSAVDGANPRPLPGLPGLPASPRRRAPAHRLRFLFIGQRARAESVSHQRQPGLLEELVRSQIHVKTWQPDVGRTLFQLAVPHDFKGALGQSPRVVLVVDDSTANLPWEMMLGDGTGGGEALPLALRMALVRQFQTSRFRREVRASGGSGAYVVGNPSVEGFVDAFVSSDPQRRLKPPPNLDGAEAEARSVAARLERLGFEVDTAIGNEQLAADVLVRLCRSPRRLLHISAHGVFEQRHVDGLLRTGVVLSGGFLITAAEIEAMDTVPDLVFLNCCHLGRIDDRTEAPLKEPNRLAASIARQLIDIGVRCVVVAGWAVTDTLAQRFGEVFYERLLDAGLPFGPAVFEARKALWAESRDDITWGAFQAYGDPDWRAERGNRGGSVRGSGPFASLDEVLDALERQRIEATRKASTASDAERDARREAVEALLRERLRPEWEALPVVQSALGNTWYVLGDFNRARQCFAQALASAGPDDAVPLHDLELLANAEARQGGRGEGNLALVDQAIGRLQQLDDAVRGQPPAGAPVPPPAGERLSLLGSAWKIKAMLLAQRVANAASLDAAAAEAQGLSAAIAHAADAYRAATRPIGDPAFDPYPALNRLGLEPLRGPLSKAALEEALRLVRECAVVARARAARSVEPWPAVMTVDALCIESMLDGRFAADGKAGEQELQRLQAAYAALLRSITIKPSELGSVTSQYTKLHMLWSALARTDAARQAEAMRVAERLRSLAESIDPKSVEVGDTAHGRWWLRGAANAGSEAASTPAAPAPMPARGASGGRGSKTDTARATRATRTPRKKPG